MYEYNLQFKLNDYQQLCSNELVKAFQQGHNCLLDAVCGAGKTEMLLETIKLALNKGYKVGFACPRRQLLIELYERLKEYFCIETIGLVVGGYKYNEQGNFIFLTCHQLTKYYKYFDLLIIDEVDAYPFYNNNDLENAAFLAAKQFIYLSATVPPKYYAQVTKNELIHISNNHRHHLQFMPLPAIKKTSSLLVIFHLFSLINNLKNDPLIIYVPTIKQGKNLEKIVKLFFKKTKFVYSNNLDEEILLKFRNGELNILISTSVLERGITLKKLNVVIYNADSFIFDEATLLQICGRVGRDPIYYQGVIVLLAKTKTKHMLNCQRKIEKYNEMSYL